MTQIYGSTNEADRFERSCSIDVDEIDKKTSRLAIVALAALAFAAGALVRATNAGATNLAAVGTKKWTCVAPYVDTELYGPSSGPLSAAGLAIWSDWPRPHQMSETESYRFQAPSEQVMTATLKSIQRYHGVVYCALGWACWKTYMGRPETDRTWGMAISQLGNGLYAAEHHEDALCVRENELSMRRRLGASEQPSA